MRKFMGIFVLMAFTLQCAVPPVHARSAMNLPEPGVMVGLSDAFAPAVLRGMKVDPADPFKFDFLVDPGDEALSGDALEGEAFTLIQYFLAAVTTPEEEVWVNLSPYEKDRIVPDAFGRTGMGRDLLAQDYILKQVTASLMYPESELGKVFWQKVYARAFALYGTSDVPVDTFNKVWIVPGRAEVYEDRGVAYIGESRMKVMLEADYLAASPTKTMEASSGVARDVIREVMIPLIEEEVNTGRNFAPLRQVYQSLILAAWYKQRLKESLLNRVYADKNKVTGVDIDDPSAHEKIYARYIEAFRKGVYDYVKDEYDGNAQETIARKYFSGGFNGKEIDHAMAYKPLAELKAWVKGLFRVSARVKAPAVSDSAVVLTDGEVSSGIDMARPVTYRIDNGPSVVTRLTQELWDDVIRRKDMTRLTATTVKTSNAGWAYTATPYDVLDEEYGITQKIIDLYLQGEGWSADDPIVVIDWGCGEGEGVRGLYETVQGLKEQYRSLNVKIIGYANDLYPAWAKVPADVSLIFDVADNLSADLVYLGIRKVHLVYSHWGVTHFMNFDREASLAHLEGLGKMLARAGEMRLGILMVLRQGTFDRAKLKVAGVKMSDELTIYRLVPQDRAEAATIDAAESRKAEVTDAHKEVVGRIYHILARIAVWDGQRLKVPRQKLQDTIKLFDEDPRITALKRRYQVSFLGIFGFLGTLAVRKLVEGFTAPGIDWDIVLIGAQWLFPIVPLVLLYVQLGRLFRSVDGQHDGLAGLAYRGRIMVHQSQTGDLDAFVHTAAHEMAHALRIPNDALFASAYEYLIARRMLGSAAADRFSAPGKVRYNAFLYSDEAYIWAKAVAAHVPDDLVQREMVLRACVMQREAFHYDVEYKYGETWTQEQLEEEAGKVVVQEMAKIRMPGERVLPEPIREEPWHSVYGAAFAKLVFEHYGNSEEALRFIWKFGEMRIAEPVVLWFAQHKEALAEDPGADMDRALLRKMFVENMARFGTGFQDAAPASDQAGVSGDPSTGGIDFDTRKMDLDIRGDASAMALEADPAVLMRYQDAPGFMPEILDISPVTDVPVFLGLSSLDSK